MSDRRTCERCRYQDVTCECVHCLREFCNECAEQECCCRKPASVRGFFPKAPKINPAKHNKGPKNAVPDLPDD